MRLMNESTRTFLSAAALALALCAGAARANVVYSNLGPGDSYDATSSWNILNNSNQIAAKFTVTGSEYRLDTVEVVLSGAPVTIYLVADGGGIPGIMMDGWDVPAGTITETPRIVSLASRNRPPLQNGVSYWVVAFFSSGTRWYWNDTGAAGMASQSSGTPWVVSSGETAPAFRVSGNPVLPAAALPMPDGYATSEALDVNNAGQIAGSTWVLNGWFASLWTGGAHTFLDTAGDGVLDTAVSSESRKINSRGQVLGRSKDFNSVPRTFLWTPDSPNGATGAMIDIGVAEDGETDCEPVDLNDAGQVLAVSSIPLGGTFHSFVRWEDGTKDVLAWTYTDPGYPYPTEHIIDVSYGDINDLGQVVGTLLTYPPQPAVLCRKVDGALVFDVLTPGVNCISAVMNNAGQVAGRAGWMGVNPWFYSPGKPLKTIDLIGRYPGLSGEQIKSTGISGDGRVLVAAGKRLFVWLDDGTAGGAFTEIPIGGWTLPGASEVVAVMNASGQVTGNINNWTNETRRSFFWDPSNPDAVRELSILPDSYNAYAHAISDAGQIVGYSFSRLDESYHAATWMTAAPTNHSPTLSGVPASAVIDETVPYAFTAAAIDEDGDPPTFGLAGAPEGAAIDPVSGVFTWTPTEEQGPGDYTFDVTVSDGTATVSETITVTVAEANAAPILAPIGNQTAVEGEELVFTVNASDPDIPGSAPTFSLTGEPAGATIQHGSGVFTWTPTEEQGPGSYTFTVTVSDGADTDSETITVIVEEANVLPILVPIDLQTVAEGDMLILTATATDADGDPLTFRLETAPDGMVVDPVTGKITWTPIEAQGPGDHFALVVVSDGTAEVHQGFPVTVVEVNQPPVLAFIGPQTITEGSMLTFTAEVTDPDTPANPLLISLAGAPEGAAIDPASGVFTWTPTEEQGPGDFTFDLVVSDGMATVNETIIVIVTEVNQPPVLTVPPGVSGTAGAPVTFTAEAIDADLPANDLTFGLAGAPAGAVIDPASGVFTWTPYSAGADTFDVTVSDGRDGFATQTVTVDVSEPPPSNLDISVETVVRRGRTVSVTVMIRNPGPDPVSNVAVTEATLNGSDTNTTLPLVYETLKAGASKKSTLMFKNVSPGETGFRMCGVCLSGGFACERMVTVR